MALKQGTEKPSIDVKLVTLTPQEGGDEIGIDTATQVQVEPQIETVDAVKLIIKGILRAQKGEQRTLTGNQITLTDNVFTPEIALILQGGIITYDSETPPNITGYTPPTVDSTDNGEIFDLSCYSGEYDSSGIVEQYEKITYPNCQGTPVALTSEDDVFRVVEYTINSAPKKGEAPYVIEYVDTLPVFDTVAPAP